MTTLILNAFSLNMLPSTGATIKVSPMNLEDVKDHLARTEWSSGVGHADTAALYSQLTGVLIPMCRLTINIQAREYGQKPWTAIVGQYSGPRLPEGAVSLPEGATIQWLWVYIA